MKSQKNYLPLCNYCKSDKQAEWEIVYGSDPCNHYTFCCSECFNRAITSIQSGQFGYIPTFYASHYSCEEKYSKSWNQAWYDRYKLAKH